MHVTAGGGGAFLHPARIQRKGITPPAAEFPGPRACLALALQIPWAIVHGRSGFLVHIGLAILLSPLYGLELYDGHMSPWANACIAVILFVACLLLGGWRAKHALAIGSLALITGAFIGFLPLLLHAVLHPLVSGLHIPSMAVVAVELACAVYGATLAFGTYLTGLTIFGLEQHQAFSALAHPGYKHFVRLRVRQSGEAVDGWVFGKVDPLNPSDPILLVDRFTWKNPRSTVNAAPSSENPST